MTRIFNYDWELTTDHGSPPAGYALLMNRWTRKTYRPEELVTFLPMTPPETAIEMVAYFQRLMVRACRITNQPIPVLPWPWNPEDMSSRAIIKSDLAPSHCKT